MGQGIRRGNSSREVITVTTFIATVFVFGLLVFFHELGHYSVAKLTGVLVYEFSLGFGPKIYGFKKEETVYNLRAIPLGGFVRMAGMDKNDEETEELDDDRSFNSKTVGQRAAVILAGPIMNFVLAALLLAFVFGFQGVPMATTVIKELVAGYPAETSGLMAGDKILAINDSRLDDWESFSAIVSKMPRQEIVVTVERDRAERQFAIETMMDAEGTGKIGVMPETGFKREGLLSSLSMGFSWTGKITVMSIDYITKMFAGREPVDLGGPVRIVDEIGKAASVGFFYLLQIAAFLSINLGMLNLLPIPALDGSRVLFLAWEKVYGRPVDPLKENYIHLAGFAFLIIVMVAVTYNDIIQLLTPK